jgi:hypothetical protein
MKSPLMIIIFLTLFSFPIAYADNDPSFPFDKECLTYDKANFKTGGALLDVMTTGDFPQYCVLYSLSKYQVKQKRDEGYFIIGSKLDPPQADATVVFVKSKMAYQQNQALENKWVYFTGIERFTMDNGTEKEFYTFQENDL